MSNDRKSDSQDVLNPSTSHCNFMALADAVNDSDHLFKYGQVLGIYHVNVVYTGPGMVDYKPFRMEFLWVCWYQIQDGLPGGWQCWQLDRAVFPSVTEDDVFGFIYPSQVVGLAILYQFLAKAFLTMMELGSQSAPKIA
jgi:hypothetical protein